VAKLFFLLSGEFESLSFSELKAILEAEDCSYSVTEKLDQTVRLEADAACVAHVQRRSSYTRVMGLELFACPAKDDTIAEAVNSVDFTPFLGEGTTFEVRVRRIKEYSTKADTMKLESMLGKLILQKTPHAKVNLSKPERTFFGLLTNGKLVFGVKLAAIQAKPFVERRPRKKPFFHPSAMNSKLARCMVNLSHAREGSYLLDPFCGTGTTIIEASLIGVCAIGVDVQRRMMKGAVQNMLHFGLKAEAVVIADARKLPFRRVDCIVTDPPYGKSATTLKSTTKAIVEGIFASARELLGVGQRICIASPKTLGIKAVGERLGYKHLESHFAYVHRTLTREVVVFEKV
jgi:tRNA (guanine10-N2)-dimethyltransferase